MKTIILLIFGIIWLAIGFYSLINDFDGAYTYFTNSTIFFVGALLMKQIEKRGEI